jgi:hypothetical protein
VAFAAFLGVLAIGGHAAAQIVFGLAAGGGSSPPATCGNALDFSDGCNSQYLGMMRL